MDFVLRTRKFMSNPLLGRRQFVVDVLHPGKGNVAKEDLAKKLAQLYKVHDVNCVVLFGFKTALGGGRSTGFGLIYDNLDRCKKLAPDGRAGIQKRRRTAGKKRNQKSREKGFCQRAGKNSSPKNRKKRTTNSFLRRAL